MGADAPSYELIGTTLRIRFRALESALIDAVHIDTREKSPEQIAEEILTKELF